LIGGFKHATSNFIVDNWAEAGYYYHITGNETNILTIKMNNGELYTIQGIETKTRMSTNKLVYLSIVQWANLDTFKLLKYTETLPNFVPLKNKMYCVYGASDPEKGKPKIPKSDAFRVMHIDNKPPKLEKSTREPRMNQLVFIDKDWQKNPKHIASETEYYNHNYRSNLEIICLSFIHAYCS
jgi:hypothetical protein